MPYFGKNRKIRESEAGLSARTANLAPPPPSWPAWARWLASVAIVLHLASVLAAEFGTPPASPLERDFADVFVHYYEALDQGHGHRFYSDIGPTAILTA